MHTFDGAAIALYVPEKDAFQLLAVESRMLSEYFHPGREVPRVGNSIGLVFDNRLSIVRRDLQKEQEYANEQRLAAMGMRSH